MSRQIPGVNKLTKTQSVDMVAAFRAAYEEFEPEDKAWVDSARKILATKKHLHLGPQGIDELICSMVVEIGLRKAGQVE